MSKASRRPLPPSILKRASGKARRFPSPQGDRVNVWAIVLKHQVVPQTVYNKLAGLETTEESYKPTLTGC